MVALSKPQAATFTRVLGFNIFPVSARATAMFGAALQAGAVPLAIDDSCTPGYNITVSAQPANGGGGFGTCNFASIVPPGCIKDDITCYSNAMANGMKPSVQLGPSYPANSFDYTTRAPETAAALQARIAARTGETCTTFVSPSPRVIWLPVVPGGFGGLTYSFVRYRAFFLTSVTPGKGITGCFVKATINGGDSHGQPAWSGESGQQNRFRDIFISRSRMALTVDTRTATEYGVVRTFGQVHAALVKGLKSGVEARKAAAVAEVRPPSRWSHQCKSRNNPETPLQPKNRGYRRREPSGKRRHAGATGIPC